VALVVVSTGRADIFITSTETVNQSVFGGSPTLLQQMRAAGSNFAGYAFDNNISHTSPQVGDLINTVAVDHFTTYVTGGTGFNRGTNNVANPQTVTVIIASQERITSAAGGVFNVAYLSGRAALYNTSGLNATHPSTWGFTGIGGATPLYSLANVPSQGIVPSPVGEGDAFAPGQINVGSVNTLAPQQAQQQVLFNEVNNGGFLVIDKLGAPPGGVFAGNGQLALVNLALNQGTLAGPSLTAADQAAMNAIFSQLDPGALNSPFGFASFGSGGATDFLPTTNVSSGDAEFTLGLNADPGNFFSGQVVVPEPATFAVWSMLLGSGGIGGLVRYYRRGKRSA
jgi:hypothetical protein